MRYRLATRRREGWPGTMSTFLAETGPQGSREACPRQDVRRESMLLG